MKRMLVFILLFVFLTSIRAIASTQEEEASLRWTELKALGIILGDHHNDLRQDEYISRGEMLTIVNRISVNVTNRSLLKDRQLFEDVPREHWAYGEVNQFYDNEDEDLGPVFGVNDPIRYDEFKNFMMKAFDLVGLSKDLIDFDSTELKEELNISANHKLFRHQVFDLLLYCLEEESYLFDIIYQDIPTEMMESYGELIQNSPQYAEANIRDFDIDMWNKEALLVLKKGELIQKLIADQSSENFHDETIAAGLVDQEVKTDRQGLTKALINDYNWLNVDKSDLLSFYNLPLYQSEIDYYANEIIFYLKEKYANNFNQSEDPTLWLSRARVLIPVSTYGNGLLELRYLGKDSTFKTDSIETITIIIRAKNTTNPIDKVIPVIGD